MSKIKSVDLYNFRCYDIEHYEFKDSINIIIGSNASGKTSLVEAIYVLLTCKSFRGASDAEMITEGKEFYSVSGKINEQNESALSIVYSKDGKKISKNGVVYKNLSDFVGEFCAIAFSPEDLRMITGDPKYRRRFLDMSISQFDKNYLNTIIEYNKLLKERNEFLKNIINDTINDNQKAMLLTLSQMLIVKGKIIIEKRKNFIDKINTYLCKYVQEISNNNEKGYIRYVPNCYLEQYEREMRVREKYDVVSGNTSCGPHRDDFEIFINDKDANSYGSQGQKKTLALSVKLSLYRVLEEYGKNGIIILDDVFGELDKERQIYLMNVLDKAKQIFITTTTLDNISENVCREYNIIKIKK